MFSTQNTLNVTKAAISQLIAKGFMDEADGDIKALDSQYIVDLGEKISAASDGTITENSAADIFFKALMSQLGKIVIDTRSYVAELPKLYVDPVNWGLFTEQIMIGLSDVHIDEMWNPDGFINFTDPATGGKLSGEQAGARIAAIEFGTYKPVVQAKLYKKCHAIMVALTTVKDQFFTAFRGLDEYNTFLAGLFNSVENTIQVKAEVYALMTVSYGIAKAKANGNEINILAEYNTRTNKSLTSNTCWDDEDFERYYLQRFAETKYNIQRYSALYNDHNMVTFAAEPQAILLNGVATELKFGVRANTYNEELIGIGEYDTVAAWQAAVSADNKAPYNLATASTIILSEQAAKEAGLDTSGVADVATNGYPITGVVGVIYDRMAMGITVDKKKTTSQYAASTDQTNFFYHALVNYVVNDCYPIVTFVVRDT